MRKNKTSTLSQRKEQSREAALLKDARRKVEGFYFCPPGGLIRQSFGDAFKIKSTTLKKKGITAKVDMFFHVVSRAIRVPWMAFAVTLFVMLSTQSFYEHSQSCWHRDIINRNLKLICYSRTRLFSETRRGISNLGLFFLFFFYFVVSTDLTMVVKCGEWH